MRVTEDTKKIDVFFSSDVGDDATLPYRKYLRLKIVVIANRRDSNPRLLRGGAYSINDPRVGLPDCQN